MINECAVWQHKTPTKPVVAIGYMRWYKDEDTSPQGIIRSWWLCDKCEAKFQTEEVILHLRVSADLRFLLERSGTLTTASLRRLINI